MTSTEIQKQISIIKEVAEKATQSKEYALKFLDDARILELINNTPASEKSKK